MSYDEKEDKKMELVGHRFKYWHPAVAAFIKYQYQTKSDRDIAYYVYDFFPDEYLKLEKEIKAELQAWIEDEEERLDRIDPPYRKDDPKDYLAQEL